MKMRDYEEMRDIAIPKEQEEMMDIVVDSWAECNATPSCAHRDCPDRPVDRMRVICCIPLKYTRKLLENGYSKRGRGHWIPENERPCSTKWICSVCEQTAYDEQHRRREKMCTLNYCPHCGAKMDLYDEQKSGEAPKMPEYFPWENNFDGMMQVGKARGKEYGE